MDTDDFFRELGMTNATDRAKELVLRGYLAELDERIAAHTAAQRRGRGAPKKQFSIDLVRADRVLGVADMLSRKGIPTQTARSLIDVAVQVEDILASLGLTDTPCFRRCSLQTLEKSVGRGLAEVGVDLADYQNNRRNIPSVSS